METSTVLQKTRRYRICEKTKLANLVNHIMRNYKPETIQYKRDFNPEDTKNNLLIGDDFQIQEKGGDWFDQVERESKFFKENLEQSLTDADELADQKISLSRSEKDKTIKSINYFSKLKNYDEDLEKDIIPVVFKCLDFKNQDKKNKDYSVIDKDEIQTALDFYSNLPKDKKVKSLNAKKKNLTQILENVESMKVANDRRATASTRSIGFEEVLFKIPKHNDKSLADVDMVSIIKDWNNEHYSNFKVLGGALHKDERTTKGNAVDDHLHLIRSGFNRETKRFDLPDYTHQKGLEMAKKQGLNFVADGKKFNETSEDLRTIASEALQTEFYKFANKKLETLGYDFRFEKKELTPEEQELRGFLKEQSNIPKAQRVQNMYSYFEEKAKEHQEKANQKIKETNKINKIRNKKVKEANEAIKKKKKIDKNINKAIEVFKTEQENIAELEIEKIEEKKGFFQKFTDKFFVYIETIQRKNIEDSQFSYTDNLKQKKSFDTRFETEESCRKSYFGDTEEEIKNRVEEPLLFKIKSKLQELFNKTFNHDDEYLENQLNKVNSIIENSNKENVFDNDKIKIGRNRGNRY